MSLFPRTARKMPGDPVRASHQLIVWIKYRSLLALGKDGVTLMRAMVLYNDLSTINYLNRKADVAEDVPFEVAQYHRHWTLRMLAIPMCETLDIAQLVRSRRAFTFLRRDPEVLTYLDKLAVVMRDGPEAQLFTDRVKALRDWIGAHVDEDEIKWAMQFRARSKRSRHSGRLELSTQYFATRMYLADDVLRDIVSRRGWKLDDLEGEELIAKGDEIASWTIDLADTMNKFLFAVVRAYVRDQHG